MSEHQQGLNAFDRAILALDLEPSLQEAAHANQQWGGKNLKIRQVGQKLRLRCSFENRDRGLLDGGLVFGEFEVPIDQSRSSNGNICNN